MKRILTKAFVLIFATALASGLAGQSLIDKMSPKFTVKVVCNAPNASLNIDGTNYGQMPATIKLTDGVAVLEAIFAAG